MHKEVTFGLNIFQFGFMANAKLYESQFVQLGLLK
jgi:hypothetical protein